MSTATDNTSTLNTSTFWLNTWHYQDTFVVNRNSFPPLQWLFCCKFVEWLRRSVIAPPNTDKCSWLPHRNETEHTAVLFSHLWWVYQWVKEWMFSIASGLPLTSPTDFPFLKLSSPTKYLIFFLTCRSTWYSFCLIFWSSLHHLVNCFNLYHPTLWGPFLKLFPIPLADMVNLILIWLIPV